VDKLEIEGGVPLRGEVQVSGAKNAVLPILAATLLADGPCVIEGVPDLRDLDTMLRILRELGVEVEKDLAAGTIRTEVRDDTKIRAPYELVKTMRASICVLGPLLGRRKRAEVSFPGGCVIGPRPIDLHLAGLEALGAEMRIEAGYILADGRHMQGREIYLGGAYGPTVTGTANQLMAAVLTPGTTVLEHAACEPEVADLARFLVKMGAKIEGIASPQLIVTGVSRLTGARHRVIPDRIEAGTFLTAAAITHGDVIIRGAEASHLTAAIATLRRMGVQVDRLPDGGLRVRAPERLHPTDLVTLAHPGFPTDLQAQFMATLAIADGNSFVTEKIYPERFIHVAELTRMRAKIRKKGPTAIVEGVDYLSGAPVMASDLRASAALVVAGLAAHGTTTVDRVYHIDRGYERIEQKLQGLGARIRRINDKTPAVDD